MRAVVQRVRSAQVTIDNQVNGRIELGYVILLGIEEGDEVEDRNWLVQKISKMRIFEDDHGKMNKDLKSVGGSVLIISQFTLFASCRKGNRPSFIRSARPAEAIPAYDAFCEDFRALSIPVQTGIFAADMQVELINDGPVTIIIDSKIRE